MADIKSAREIAMEKVEKLGGVTEDERLEWRYVPEGEKLGVNCLKEDCNLAAELGKYEEKAKRYVISGATEVLVRNIGLPKNELARRNNKKAMAALKTLKKDKVAAENVFSKVRRILDHYAAEGEQQRKQAYESVKAEVGARLQQAVQQQMGTAAARVKINVERHPMFHEEWRRVQAQLDLAYIKHLDEYKQELLSIP